MERQVHEPSGMSWGLSAAGYDVRLAQDVRLWPGAFRLASVIEYVSLPDDIMAFVKDKSTLARRGLAVQNTVLEPGWRGYTTLELTNHGGCRLRLEAGTPVAQLVFCRLEAPTEAPYRGKYQDQEQGPQGPRMEAGSARV